MNCYPSVRQGIAFLAVVLLGVPLGATAVDRRQTAAPPDLVLLNGSIYTVDAAQPRAEAMAVTDGRFSFVGSDAEARQLVGPQTKMIDLRGSMVLPGINDSHIHAGAGEYYNRRLCNVRSFSLEEGYERLAACVRAAPPGDWVVAFGWYGTDNPEISNLSIAKLDALVPDRKLAVIERDAHTVWVNSKTLQAFSISRDTPDPVGGRIVRNPATGEPTGALLDAANHGVKAEIRSRSAYAARQVDLHRTVVPHLNSLGITSMLDAYATDDIEAAYRALDREGGLSMRVSLAFAVTADKFRAEVPRIAAKRAQNTERIKIDFLKVFADGNAEDGLANMLEPDGKPGASSKGYFTQEEMNELVLLAESHRLSLYVHTIGDGAARQVLDAVAAARGKSPCDWCRHTLTHIQWIYPSDRARLKNLNVIANIQEGWLAPRSIGGPPGYDYVKDTADGPLGPVRAASMYPYRPLRDAGARLSAGSDWFYTDENPWNDIEAGVTSRDPGDPDSGPMLPGHALDVKSLLTARTLDGAYQMQNERETGSIEVGKRADFVVIDRDILRIPADRVHETRVLMTFFDGKRVAGQGIAWRDNFTTRLEALALLQSLNADLLTLTLDRWCKTRLATPAEIVADRDPKVDKAPTAEQRRILRVTESEPVHYRQVQLRCGIHVLSEAENWYVPSRLTPEINEALETTSIAFGRAVQALHFRRQTLSAKLLWSPLPEGWEMGAASGPAGSSSTTLQIPSEVLQHRAVLTLPDGTPFSTVIETYTDDVLAFPEPPASKCEMW